MRKRGQCAWVAAVYSASIALEILPRSRSSKAPLSHAERARVAQIDAEAIARGADLTVVQRIAKRRADPDRLRSNSDADVSHSMRQQNYVAAVQKPPVVIWLAPPREVTSLPKVVPLLRAVSIHRQSADGLTDDPVIATA